MRATATLLATFLALGCGGDGKRRIGEPCDAPADCLSGFCEAQICIEPGPGADAAADSDTPPVADVAPDAPSDTVDATFDLPSELGDADVAPPDAALDVPDADAGDGEVGDSGGPTATICQPVARDVVLWGNHPLTNTDGQFGWPAAPVTFLPGGPDATTVLPLEPEVDRLHVYVARMNAGGLAWSAQVVASSPTSLVTVSELRYDPDEDAVYAGLTTNRGDRAVRFYSADGTLAREFAPGGEEGSDVVGLQGQANLFIVRYDSQGAVSWVHRFGPNDVDGRRGAGIDNLQRVGSALRVTGWVSYPAVFPNDPGEVVLGLGQEGELRFDHPEGLGYMADFDLATGAYVQGSLVMLTAEGQFASGPVGANGQTNAAGQRVMAASHFGPFFGEVSLAETTLTAPSPSTFLFKYAPPEDSWGRLVVSSEPTLRHDARAMALLDDGSVLLGLYDNSSTTGDIDYFLDTDTDPLTVSMERRDGLIVRYTPPGGVAWTSRVDTNGTDNWLDTLTADEPSDALYLGGRVSNLVSFPRTDAAPLTVTAGDYLARYALSTGEVQWVAHLEPTVGNVVLGVPRVTESAIHLPVRFSELRLGGETGPLLRTPSGADTPGELILDPNGDLVSCAVFADTARETWHTPPVD